MTGTLSDEAVAETAPRTLDDVAALSGVSRATVSRVINGGRVSDAMRRRVEAAIAATNFRPNAAARTLASGRSGAVGVVMHIDPHALFADPYFSQLLQGMSDALSEQAAGMMLWLGHRSKEETLDHILWMGLLDGVIVTAQEQDDPLVDGLLASSLPAVLVGHRRDDPTASYVDIDHVHAADAITSHLVSLGRRRIGHITGRRGTVAGEDRIAGYRRAMQRARLPIDGLVVDGDFNEPSGTAGALRLIDQGIDALFCGNDAMAAGALAAIRSRGLRVPEDVALAGFDDLEFAARMQPPLTTVRQGVRQLGSEAARTLFQLLNDPAGSPRRVILPTELVIRQSTVGDLESI
ncbi:MAG: LacI family DNA-binding transcriptional regulator [Chloroflexi bacterium]|nr:LacI family DNA-binding transcriptional regulator [Chloroflexota bacterium]